MSVAMSVAKTLASISQFLLSLQAQFNELDLMWRMMITMFIVGFLCSQIYPLMRAFGNFMMRYFGERMKYEAKVAMVLSAGCGIFYVWKTWELYLFFWYAISIMTTGVVTDIAMRVSHWMTKGVTTGEKNHK